MTINAFKLEDYLTQYEFNSPFLFCCSDAESFAMSEVVHLANMQERNLWEKLQLKYTEPFGFPLLRSTIAQVMYGHMCSK